jgi:hypothetical protein
MKQISMLFLVAMMVACGNKQDAEKPRATAAATENTDDEDADDDAPEAKAAVSLPDACTLLELQEVKLAAGWQEPVAGDVTVDRSYQRSCNFVDSANPARYVSVTLIAGGAKYADSAAFAKAVGDGDGMLTHPAAPVTDFGFPVIETQMGEIFSLRGNTKQGIELTVSSPAPRITRELFVAALSRL